MGIQTVNSVEARRRLGEFLECVQNQGTMVRILSKEKPMAWPVGDNFMQSMGTLVECIIDHEPALADTLALSLDAEIRDVLDQGNREYKAGKTMPLDRILEVT